MMDTVCVFAPASTGNIGPGFDVLGMALSGMGDCVRATRRSCPGVEIAAITGAGAERLPCDPVSNTAGIAAQAVLDRLGVKDGVLLTLEKGISGTGLGGSAASAVAAASAVNALWNEPLRKADLIPLAAVAESKVSGGFFLDNIGPSMMGGITLTHPQTKEVLCLGTLPEAVVVLGVPEIQLLTRRSREVLPQNIPMAHFISNMAHTASMTWAVARGDVPGFGRAIYDLVAEPVRAPLIRGFTQAKAAAIAAGAYGCSISGAGASLFAITDDLHKGEQIGAAIQAAFQDQGVKSYIRVTTIDACGARVIHEAHMPFLQRSQSSHVPDHA